MGIFYREWNHRLIMFARSLAGGKLFAFCKPQNPCEENGNAEVQVDWPWANDAFIFKRKNNKHNWPAFHIRPISVRFASQPVCFSFFPLCFFSRPWEAKAKLWRTLLWTWGPVQRLQRAQSPSVSFLQFQNEVRFLSPTIGVRFLTIDSGS